MNFSNIIGNEKQKEYLNNSIKDKKVLHSYLFSGTVGIGKKLIASEFARKILCLEDGDDFCKCKSCLCFNGQNHPDFSIINEQEDTIKVDQVRDFIKKVYEKPILSNKKVYILNEADKMTKEAQNSLLKTLEEPPESTVIILITSNENAILNTIKSRSMRVNFENISDKDLIDYANSIGMSNISDNMLKSFGGSIGNVYRIKQNEGLYTQIEQFVDNIVQLNKIQILKSGKILYDKELIYDILDYLIVCFYNKGRIDKRFLDCVTIVISAIEHFKSNSNFDMTLDTMLFDICDIFNN